MRSVDGGHPLPRARVVLRLAGIVPDAGRAPGYDAALTRTLEIDLFEPTQRESARMEAAQLESEGLEQRDIARRLGVTQAAVFNALKLSRLMRERGLDSPYQPLAAPPEGYGKLPPQELQLPVRAGGGLRATAALKINGSSETLRRPRLDAGAFPLNPRRHRCRSEGMTGARAPPCARGPVEPGSPLHRLVEMVAGAIAADGTAPIPKAVPGRRGGPGSSSPPERAGAVTGGTSGGPAGAGQGDEASASG